MTVNWAPTVSLYQNFSSPGSLAFGSRVTLPGMLPSMAQGLKLGWSFSWRSLMAGELIFVSAGLGHLLPLGRDLNNMGLVLAIMAVIVAVGLAFDRIVFGPLENWVRHRWGLAAG